MNNIYIVRDLEAPPGELPTLVGLVQDEPTPRTNAMFVESHVDPVLGSMIYPVTPDEWGYFALDLPLDYAKFLMWLGVRLAPFALYLGFPADE